MLCLNRESLCSISSWGVQHTDVSKKSYIIQGLFFNLPNRNWQWVGLRNRRGFPSVTSDIRTAGGNPCDGLASHAGGSSDTLNRFVVPKPGEAPAKKDKGVEIFRVEWKLFESDEHLDFAMP